MLRFADPSRLIQSAQRAAHARTNDYGPYSVLAEQSVPPFELTVFFFNL
jgi:hypothetical protein